MNPHAPQPEPPRPEVRPRGLTVSDWCALILCSGVLAASALLSLGPEGRAVLGASIVLPPVCLFRQLTGTDCPGCGLARSFIAMSHGHFAAAWRFHHVGPLAYLFVVIQVPYRAVRIASTRFRQRTDGRIERASVHVLLAIVGLMLLDWLFRLLRPL